MVKIFSRTIMPLAKISSSATYHKVIIELHEYGYLRYEPSTGREVKYLSRMTEVNEDEL